MAEFHKAEFHRGSVFECLSNRLSIEGRPVRLVDDRPATAKAELATGETFTADSLPQLAKRIIDDADEFKKRRELAKEHCAILDECANARDDGRSWNEWRQKHPTVHPMLAEQELNGRDLSGFDFSYTNLCMAKLRYAKLKGTSFHQATLAKAECYAADFSDANFCRTDLYETDLRKATLIKANLQGVQLAMTDCRGAQFDECTVYGLSAWDLKLDGAIQKKFRILYREPISGREQEVEVDDIEVAQFIYLLLHNEKIRNVIDTIGKKGVLLLSRFTDGRMPILEKLREKLHSLGFVPMVFNFDKPETQDFIGTVRLLCNLSRFVIVDITKPRSAPAEMQALVPDYMVPFAPILQQGEEPFSTFIDLQKRYPWVLDLVRYSSVERLIEVLEDEVVRFANAKFNELLAPQPLRVKDV